IYVTLKLSLTRFDFHSLPTHLTLLYFFFFFNDPPTTEIYTLSLHDALPIYLSPLQASARDRGGGGVRRGPEARSQERPGRARGGDRKSTRLNSSHDQISYAVFCLKKKKKKKQMRCQETGHEK